MQEDMNEDFERWIDEVESDQTIPVGLEDDALPETVKSSEEIELDNFRQTLADAKNLLLEKGEFVGLCEFCLGTDKIMATRMNGYSGVEYRFDNESVSTVRCHHGEDITEGFGF